MAIALTKNVDLFSSSPTLDLFVITVIVRWLSLVESEKVFFFFCSLFLFWFLYILKKKVVESARDPETGEIHAAVYGWLIGNEYDLAGIAIDKVKNHKSFFLLLFFFNFA